MHLLFLGLHKMAGHFYDLPRHNDKKSRDNFIPAKSGRYEIGIIFAFMSVTGRTRNAETREERKLKPRGEGHRNEDCITSERRERV